MLKLGIVDFDTSHVVQFARRLNHVGIEEEQWVEGARIVLGCPGESRVSPERIPGFAKTLSEECGVQLVDRIEDLIGKIDAVLIESNDARVHLERARPFIEAGVPCFIDKPFAASAADAEQLAGLAAQKNVPLFSASALRYAPEVAAAAAARAELGKPAAAHVYGVQNKKSNVPGWFFYGVHAVEMLFTLLGPGHGKIEYLAAEAAEHAMTRWKNGALGAVTLTSQGGSPFGFSYIGEQQTRAARVETKYIYRELLKRIVPFLESGQPPLPIEETIAIVQFLEDVGRAGAA